MRMRATISHYLPSRAAHLIGALCAVALLAGCGGSGGDGGGGAASPPPPPPPPPPANQAPIASFVAATSVAAGAPLPLDAAASSDPDNDVLTFSWDFGDGTRGGGAQIAHVFPAGGNYTVTLTVADGRGATATATRAINVQAAPAPGTPVQTTVFASDSTGPLSDVVVGVVGGNASTNTGVDGKAAIATGVGAPLQLRLSKGGYADQFKTVHLPAGAASGYLEVKMHAREAPLTLTDAAAGGTLTGKDGSVIVFGAGSLVDAGGNPVSGPVQVNVTPIDVGASTGAFPGQFQGYQAAGTRGLIASYGTVEYVLTKNGAPVQLAPGRTATIEIPLYTSLNLNGSSVAPGDVIPLWSLDERTSAWVQEGQGTVVTNFASPSELALRAEVGHFSWWNCDQWLGAVPDGSYNPRIKCCIKDEPNGPCKENSGDVCEHSGTGPGNASSGNSANSARVRLMAANPATRRLPATAAFTTASALEGAVLPMPADLDVTLVSSARNGTYRGTRVVRGAAGVQEDVTVTVLPVSGGGSNDTIMLPWDQVYSMQAIAEIDRYKLALPVGPGFELRVAQAASSLTGSVKVIRPNGSVVAQVPFTGSAAYIAEPTVATAGDYTIEIIAGSNAPGAYRLDAASFGTCSSSAPLALPASPGINLGPQQARCFDVTLAADEVIRIAAVQAHNNIAGSFSFSTAGGVQLLAAREYPAGLSGPRDILTGVAVAGTYRLRIVNTSLNSGLFEFTVSKPAAEILNVPDARTLNDLAIDTPRLYVIKPPADGLFHLTLAASGMQAGVDINPMLSAFLVGCATCSTPVTQTMARVARAPSPVLPVAIVFRNVGAAGSVVVSTGVPTVIARDTDVSGTVGATPAVYTFEGSAGDPIAFAIARPENSGSLATLGVFAPSGGTVSGTVPTLAESGPYTAFVDADSGGSNPFTFRVNNAPAPVPLALTPPLTEQTVDLPLGQVRRYTFNLAQGGLVGLNLATPGVLNLVASIGGINEGAIATPTSGSGPFDVATPPVFVNSAGNYTLTLRSQSTDLERARGVAIVGVRAPVPVDATPNAVNGGTLGYNAWTSYRYVVPAGGRYLLRVRSAASPSQLAATVWASTSPLSNYAGEFTSSWSTVFGSTEALGLLAAGTYTMTVRSATTGAVATPFAASLVNLEEPAVLAPNAAASAGMLDTDGERDYFSFDGTGGLSYTVRVTAAFAGTVRVRKRSPNADFTARLNEMNNLGGTPLGFAAGVELAVPITIPNDAQFGNGVYIVEIVSEGTATGAYSVRVASP